MVYNRKTCIYNLRKVSLSHNKNMPGLTNKKIPLLQQEDFQAFGGVFVAKQYKNHDKHSVRQFTNEEIKNKKIEGCPSIFIISTSLMHEDYLLHKHHK